MSEEQDKREERKSLFIQKATAHFDSPELREEAAEMFDKRNPIEK